MTRIHRYLLALPCTTPEHEALRVLLAAWTQGPLPRESARRWAEAAGAPHLVNDARRFLRGVRKWPTYTRGEGRGRQAWPATRKRSLLVEAVERWEAETKPSACMGALCMETIID